MDKEYLTTAEAAKYTTVSLSYLAKLRMGTLKVQGPAFVRIGLRSIRYRKSDLDSWMTSGAVSDEER